MGFVMYHIHSLNKISPKGTALLSDKYQASGLENADAILVRSAAMHDMDIPESLLAVARAGAGVNNIPLDKMAEAGVVVFNTPGANANSVMELALCGMLEDESPEKSRMFYEGLKELLKQLRLTDYLEKRLDTEKLSHSEFCKIRDELCAAKVGDEFEKINRAATEKYGKEGVTD